MKPSAPLIRSGTPPFTSPDGINVYGDLVSTNLSRVKSSPDFLAQLPNPALANLVPDVNVSRTGYDEADLTNYDAKSIKADWGLYFRPWENDFEIQYVGKIGSGSTIYQGSNRYQITNFFLQQHKLEIKNKNFYKRSICSNKYCVSIRLIILMKTTVCNFVPVQAQEKEDHPKSH